MLLLCGAMVWYLVWRSPPPSPGGGGGGVTTLGGEISMVGEVFLNGTCQITRWRESSWGAGTEG